MTLSQYIFTVQSTAISWTDAEADAVGRGGHLASLSLPDEEALALGVIADHPEILALEPHDTAEFGHPVYNGPWFGLHQVADSGGGAHYEWTDGSTYDYNDWKNGQPDDLPNGADYGHFWKPGATIGWGDQVNDPSQIGYGGIDSYIVEMNAGAVSLAGTGSEDLIYGGAIANAINGNDGGDWLYGRMGFDSMDGGAGHDRLFGDKGDDRLTTSGDGDRLSGGKGGDTYVFTDFTSRLAGVLGNLEGLGISSFGAGLQPQAIRPAGDTIDLSAVDADTTQDGVQHFTQVVAFDGQAGEMEAIYRAGAHGGRTVFLFDTDGDSHGDHKIVAEHGDYTTFTGFVGVDQSGLVV